MKLKNNFTNKTRNIFLGLWECWLCGQNGQNTNGLELHHIRGRDSKSPLNAAILCGVCHSHCGHNQEEERKLLQKTARFLCRIDYKFNVNDLKFYAKNKKLYN